MGSIVPTMSRDFLTGLGRMERRLGGPSQAEVGRKEALTVPMIAGRAGVDAFDHLPPLGRPRRAPRRRRGRASAPGRRAGGHRGGRHRPRGLGRAVCMEEMSSEVGRALLRDILGNASEAGQSLQCCSFTGEQLQVIADRAVARGERSFEVDDALDQVIAPIMYRILFFGGPVPLLPRAAGAVLGAIGRHGC